ncbi:MAG: glycine/sarcosine/betaine reductase selenoprotein B family protein [Gemmatimonadales bacterium]|jgi:D-proline reductase (dithiol) PrdB
MDYPERDLNLHGKAWLAWGIGPQRGKPVLQAVGKPLGEARLALVTTGGLVPPGAEPFSTGKLGDPSFREIPVGIPPDELEIFHPHYDHAPARRDINIVFPLPLARELVAEGEVGQLTDTHYSFMGYVPRTRRLEQIYAPQVAARLRQEAADAVLLAPA